MYGSGRPLPHPTWLPAGLGFVRGTVVKGSFTKKYSPHLRALRRARADQGGARPRAPSRSGPERGGPVSRPPSAHDAGCPRRGNHDRRGDARRARLQPALGRHRGAGSDCRLGPPRREHHQRPGVRRDCRGVSLGLSRALGAAHATATALPAALAHVIDMHQLSKDPEQLSPTYTPTAQSIMQAWTRTSSTTTSPTARRC
jgi:hypothetical protein